MIDNSIQRKANAIILAAGRGSRLKQLTDEIPKCLLKVGGKSLLEWQMSALRSAGIASYNLISVSSGIFVSTNPVSTKSKNYMNWEQIKEMVNSGVSVGHHTNNHFHLADKNEDFVTKEIEVASKEFLKQLGFVPDIFAYPYGEYSLKTKQIVKNYFKASFGQQSGSVYNEIDLFELPRYAMNEQYGDLKRFKFAANSYGLKINNILPKDKMITDINPPILGFTLIDDIENKISCYPSHNINANINKIGNSRIEIRFDREFPKGRTRVNCTTNDKGKWRWTGFQFINP